MFNSNNIFKRSRDVFLLQYFVTLHPILTGPETLMIVYWSKLKNGY